MKHNLFPGRKKSLLILPILALTVFSMVLIITPGAAISAETGDVCIIHYGVAGCTAQDFGIKALNWVSTQTDCNAGNGFATATFDVVVSTVNPKRYDIGMFIALDGQSAATGHDCYHDFLDKITPPDPGPVNLDGGPWPNLDGDQCGDLDSNMQATKKNVKLTFKCVDVVDANGNPGQDGIVDINTCGSYDNNASTPCSGVSGAKPGTSSKCGCNWFSTGIPMPAISDLAVTKTDAPDPVTAGNNLTYTINVTNNGPQPSTNVVLTDTLPTSNIGLPPVSANSTKGICSYLSGVETCTIGPMAVGEVVTITIVVSVNGATPNGTVLSNTASVTGTEADSNLTNNQATATTAVSNVPTQVNADLSITKSDNPDPVAPNSDLVYTLIVTNNGPDPAVNVTFTDHIPAGTTFKAKSTTRGTCNLVSNELRCNLGDMSNGATATITLTVTVASAVVGPINNSATVGSSTSDPNPSNNTATATTTVLNVNADLSITKSDNPDPVAPNTNLVYTLIVTNNGPDTAENVRVTDPIPAGTTYDSHSTTSGTCNLVSNELRCNLGDMSNGATATITLTVTVASAVVGPINNTSTVQSDTADPDPTNNTDTENTNVRVPTPPSPTVVPTMTEWGLIIFMILAGVGSIYYLRRQRRTR